MTIPGPRKIGKESFRDRPGPSIGVIVIDHEDG